jgi:dTDP-4-dehydrorhamnose 3,5-epimerase
VIFTETDVLGVTVIDLEPLQDDRGFFARSFCRRQFEEQGLHPEVVQCNISGNNREGTLRGLHLQLPPHQEAKLIRCTRGSIWDVAVDLRADSPTYLRWFGAELTADNRRMLYVPEGCAHGFQSLTDATEVFYQISAAYEPDAQAGVRWDDPAFGIQWPATEFRSMSARDRTWPDFEGVPHGVSS